MIGRAPVALDRLPFVHGYAGLGQAFTLPAGLTGLRGAELLHVSRAGCELIGLDPQSLESPQATSWFAGEGGLPGSQPVAAAYSGHQFGLWAGQLGDGRALLLGELRNARGDLWDVQLKGSGRTPFSRFGDGRAVLRSTLREYVAGEALAGLGIPTTRSLAIYRSDEDVEREQTEKGALLVRLARCHVRIGTFEHFHSKDRFDQLRVLFGYSLGRWYPHLSGRSGRALAFLLEVAESNARLIARWMAVGFCHGVMNTDNMSMLGETIDYGPFAFLDDYDPRFICNCSDVEGRYAFAMQPGVGLWNLHRLAEAMAPLIEGTAPADLPGLVSEAYGSAFNDEFQGLAARKLGLERASPELGGVLQETLALLEKNALDYTRFWRELCHVDLEAERPELAGWDDEAGFATWWKTYVSARRSSPFGGSLTSSREAMLATSPKFVARNYLLQELIAEPDPNRQRERLDRWLAVLASPFDEHPGNEDWAAPPVGAQRAISIGCSS